MNIQELCWIAALLAVTTALAELKYAIKKQLKNKAAGKG